VRVLFLTHRLPYAPNRGDRVRAYHLLRVLSARADVDLLSLVHDAEEASHAGDLQSMAASVTTVAVPRLRNLIRTAAALPTRRPATHTMLDAPELSATVASLARRSPDVVLAYCSGMARCALEPSLRGKPLVLDMVDVDSAKWSAMADAHAAPFSWVYAREARVLRPFEAVAAEHAVANLVVTDKERRTLSAIAPKARVEVVPNGVEAGRLKPTTAPDGQPLVVFCGVMNYEPNREGVIWFAREVWPLVTARLPDARFDIVGMNPPSAVQALASVPGVTVVGAVPDVAPHLWKAAVSVAPLLTARGIQNKVLEAVASGLPTVVTPIVADGLPDLVMPACRVAAAPKDFADAVLTFLEWTPERRRDLALSVDFGLMSWDRTLAPVFDLLEAAAKTAIS
jgi:sugar transferase (PEP-CTERM/EpsH1 system associated)